MANKVIRIVSNWTGNVRYKCAKCDTEGSAHWATFHPCPAPPLPDPSELSDWQPPMSRPTKSNTIWQRKLPGSRPDMSNVIFSRWTGRRWMFGEPDIESAAKSRTPSVHQNLPWRGLKYDPNRSE